MYPHSHIYSTLVHWNNFRTKWGEGSGVENLLAVDFKQIITSYQPHMVTAGPSEKLLLYRMVLRELTIHGKHTAVVLKTLCPLQNFSRGLH